MNLKPDFLMHSNMQRTCCILVHWRKQKKCHNIGFWKAACAWIQTMSASGAFMTSAKEVYLQTILGDFMFKPNPEYPNIQGQFQNSGTVNVNESGFQGQVTHLAAASPGQNQMLFRRTVHGNTSGLRLGQEPVNLIGCSIRCFMQLPS